MLRRKYTFIIILTIVIICIFVGISISFRDSIISIKNDTDITISGLKIIYSNSNNEIKVPAILQKRIFRTKLILPENFTEGSIKILYSDNFGKSHEVYIEGYIERGYKEKINVIIDSVDDKGVLSIKIDIQRGLFLLLNVLSLK